MTTAGKPAGLPVGAPGEGPSSPPSRSLPATGRRSPGPQDPPGAPEITQAYVFSRGLAGRVGVTPADQIEAGIWRIARCWNASIPRNHIRILTVPRAIELCGVLRVFTVSQVCEAIEFYGRQRWQRAGGKWKRFDNWMVLEVVTQWVEAELDAREDAAKRMQYSARIARQHRETAEAKRAERDAELARRKRFRSLPAARQKELKDLARKRLGADGKPAGSFTDFILEMAAITIMDEGAADDNDNRRARGERRE